MAKKDKTAAEHQEGNGPPSDETVSGYFRRIFQENPSLLKARSNAAILERWLADHPGQRTIPDNIKQGLSNVKSVLRGRRRRRIRRHDAELPEGTPAPVRRPLKGLPQIEEMIDDAISLAKVCDREGLDDIIQLLRQARNAVVWKMGQ